MPRTRSWLFPVAVVAAVTATSPTALPEDRRPAVTAAAEVAGRPGDTVPVDIAVGPADLIPQHSFVRLRGLPAGTRLSAGNAVSPTIWAVPLGALAGLQLTVPVDAPAKTSVSIALMTIDGEILAERPIVVGTGLAPGVLEPRATLALASPPRQAALPVPPAPTKADPARAAPPPAPLPAPRPQVAPPVQQTPDDRSRAQALVQRAAGALERGDIAAARAFLERAVELRDAAAAFRLAATFDPVELPKLGAVGVRPDPAAARRWYEKARELGADGAEDRLKRLADK